MPWQSNQLVGQQIQPNKTLQPTPIRFAPGVADVQSAVDHQLLPVARSGWLSLTFGYKFMHIWNTVVFTLIYASAAFTAPAIEPSEKFLGKWYTETFEDRDLYGTTLFTQIDILSRNQIFFRMYGFDQDEKLGRVARVFMEVPGTYTIDEQILIATFPELPEKVNFRNLDKGTLLMTDLKNSASGLKLLSASKAPWSESILTEEAEQGAAANP